VLPDVDETLDPLPKLQMGLLLRHKTTDNNGMSLFHYSLVCYSNFYVIFLGFQIKEFSNTSQHIGYGSDTMIKVKCTGDSEGISPFILTPITRRM